MRDFSEFLKSKDKLASYRKLIGSDSLETLKQCVGGTKDVWACRWVYTHFKNNAFGVCPKVSYVQNIGQDGSGANCGVAQDEEIINVKYPDVLAFPESTEVDAKIFNQFMDVYNKDNTQSIVTSKMKKKSIKKRIKKVFAKLAKTQVVPKLFDKLTTNTNEEVICLGTAYGGWRVIPSLISDGDQVLSAGVGEDMSFDFAMVNIFGADVILMDPTPRALKHYQQTRQFIESNQNAPINNSDINYKYDENTLSHLSYLEYGLWNKECTIKFYVPKQETHVSHSIGNLHETQDYFEAECRTLKSLVNSGQLNSCSILKLDIEGAEFAVVRDFIRVKSMRPKQLLIEFHPGQSRIEKKYRLKTLLHSFMLWTIGYRIVSIHGWDYQFVHSRAL